jgi:UDP-N-acetylmuramyl pentapeptide phosphotransferase/UDP-N-acetylglucosamine-1-phosphate transferase
MIQADFDFLSPLITPLAASTLIGLSALATAGLIRLLLPVFRRYALARPNARSSHQIPTPQGGGFAVILVSFTVFFSYFHTVQADRLPTSLLVMMGASLVLMIFGGVDDVNPLPALPRFLLQGLLIAVTLMQLSAHTRLLPDGLPLPIEQILIGLALLWFLNLVNFMDGIDLITVAEMLPLWILIFGFSSVTQDIPLLVLSLCLIGALLGFLPFNWPVARLFLGDVGSLPLGLISGWALLKFAYATSAILALVPALYYIADATLTLFNRLLRCEKIWHPHRSHYYQRACQNGQSVLRVVTHIALCNSLLLIITWSGLTLRREANPLLVDLCALALACFVVTALLRHLSRRQIV